MLIRQAVPAFLRAFGYGNVASAMAAIRPIKCGGTAAHATFVLHHIADAMPDGPAPLADILFWCEAIAHSAACVDATDFLISVKALERHTSAMTLSLSEH